MSSDRQQQLDECLEAVYSGFSESPHSFYISRGGFIQIVENNTSVDDGETQDLWALFNDRYVQPRPSKNSDLLNLSAIERADELGMDVPVADDLQEEIVDRLYDEYLDSPSRPAVPRDDLLDELDYSEQEIDLNVYVLKLQNWVEAASSGIGNQAYRNVELTQAARNQLS